MAEDDWDPMDHPTMRKKIEEGTIEEWSRAFPAEYGGIRVEAKNLRFVGKANYSLKDQKKAWMENRELGRSLKADLELYDRETGEQLDAKPDLTLMKVPHYTDRGTFVYNGNNYTCLHGTSKVWTEEGMITIAQLVRERRKVRVWSWDFDTNSLVLRPVVSWFKNRGKAGCMQFSAEEGAAPSVKRGGTNFSTLWCTGDHELYNVAGFKIPAERATKVTMLEERLNYAQRQMVLGTMLGDGCIQAPGIYRAQQCEAQREYNEIKLRILGSFVAEGSELKDLDSYSVDRVTKGLSNRFHTCSSTEFKKLRQSIYPTGTRNLDTDWHLECDEMALAFWFCDDGDARYQRQNGRRTNSPMICLHTENFTLADVEKLKNWILTRWGLKSHVARIPAPKDGRTNFNPELNRKLVLTGNSAWRLLELVAPWVPDCLAYKLLDPPHTHACERGCGREIDAQRATCTPCYMQEVRETPGSLSKSIRSLYGSSAKIRKMAAQTTAEFDDTNTLSRWQRIAKNRGTGLPAIVKEVSPQRALIEVESRWYADGEGKSYSKTETVYDLEVEGTHNYFANGVLVSNCAHQARLMPGAFTRRQANGALETQFNSRVGTGRAFRVGLDQETGQFRLKIAGSNLHLYSVLKDSGVSDAELEQMWGPEILEMNRKKYDARSITKAFQKFVPKYVQPQAVDAADRGALLMDALDKAQVSKAVTDRTLAAYWKPRETDKMASGEIRSMLRLFFPAKKAAAPAFDIRSQLGAVDDEGDEYRSVGLGGLLAATRKLLAVNRGLDTPDDRSIPAFTKIYTGDKLMRERIRFDEGRLRRNILRMVAARRNLSPIHNRVFDPYYKEIITKNPLTTPIEETNPLQLVGQQRRITHMGPGGIGSTDAVTPDMQMIQANEMGYYSVLEGPESSSAGVDVRLSWGVKLGKDGRMRRPMLNRRTGVLEEVSPDQIYDKFVKLPD